MVDTNIYVGCIDAFSAWHEWSTAQRQTCIERLHLHVNLIIYIELPVPVPDTDALDALLDVYDTLRSALPWPSASLAAAASGLYRRRDGLTQVTLPDFSSARMRQSQIFEFSRGTRIRMLNYFPNLMVVWP